MKDVFSWLIGSDHKEETSVVHSIRIYKELLVPVS
jgi:hypothetical protein